MSKNIDIEIKQWVQRWESAAVEMDHLKQKELAELSTTTALNNLSRAFDFAMKNAQVRKSSGLVEQQAYFKKLRDQ
jgi:hypothetical protein